MPEDAQGAFAPPSSLPPSLPAACADPLCTAAAQGERGEGAASYTKIRPGTRVIFVSAQLTPTQKPTEKGGKNKSSLFPSAERRFCKLLSNRCEGVVRSYYLHKIIFLTVVCL